jgi:hypothetical protein
MINMRKTELLFRSHSDKTCQIVRQTIRLRLVLHPLSHATHPNPQTDHAKHYIINLINPVRESEISSAIDVTTQMDFEEASAKRKINNDNHSPRPGHPRYSDLFDQPCSGAPIVIHLISKPNGLHERPNRHHRSSQSGHKVDTPRIP